MLTRRTPLKARASLRRKTQLRTRAAGMFGPGTSLKRTPPRHAKRKGLKPASGKRLAENRERRAMKERRWPNGERPRCARPGCPRLADDLHEILTRARGGSITDEANTAPLCRQDNDELTLEPDWGYDLGLLRHSWDGPPGGGATA
jgi:hypothetical protein